MYFSAKYNPNKHKTQSAKRFKQKKKSKKKKFSET